MDIVRQIRCSLKQFDFQLSILELHNITKQYGGNTAVNNLSLNIKEGQINLLMGSNGSGKTTTINALSGLLRIDEGQILLDGRDISKKRPDEIFNLGIIRTFQTPRLFSNLSALENLLMARYCVGESFRLALLQKRWEKQEEQIRETALDILRVLGLEQLSSNLAYDLSGGQIKLLELAKTLMSDSKIVLLDEPIAGIAPKLAHEIFKKICDINKTNKTTFLIVEHRLDIALEYSHHAFVMDNGELIAQDAPDKILADEKVISSYLR